MTFPVLETERLILRQHQQSDFEATRAFYAHETASRFIGGPLSAFEAWRRLTYMIGHWALRGYGMFALELKETGDYVGRAGPYYPHGWPEPEIGWTLMLGHHGKGYATEAALAGRAFAYRDLGWTTAISLIDPDNTPSIRVAERLGATFEKVFDPGFGECRVYRHPSPEALGITRMGDAR